MTLIVKALGQMYAITFVLCKSVRMEADTMTVLQFQAAVDSSVQHYPSLKMFGVERMEKGLEKVASSVSGHCVKIHWLECHSL